ncbi:coil containing protein [Vibrio phage 1.225.O._10N.261.48.B7]|nr:coil containing protein [Vibrio phage 1.225.O._10N.261.48.B7]
MSHYECKECQKPYQYCKCKQERKMNLVELQNKIHAQNKELGWWNEERPFSTFVCLFHSELSEAMEGDRKDLMDDKLPKYPMFQVELADFVIRCLDWLGAKGNIDFDRSITDPEGCDACEAIATLHSLVSCAYDERELAVEHLVDAVNFSFILAMDMNFDLDKIILEKVEYNKHRPDHKLENRAKEGGKKY